MLGPQMTVNKTHTGIVITKDGPKEKQLHETASMWVVEKTECSRKVMGAVSVSADDGEDRW